MSVAVKAHFNDFHHPNEMSPVNDALPSRKLKHPWRKLIREPTWRGKGSVDGDKEMRLQEKTERNEHRYSTLGG